VLSGIPVLRGLTVKDKMEHFKKNFDELRKLLLHEPRGHQGIFGAVIIDPSDSRAQMGVFFLTHSGYLNMCVHSVLSVRRQPVLRWELLKNQIREIVSY